MHDYSQWGEQALILDFFKDRKTGTFLDLGAWDGVTGSNTRALLESGWHGVYVEPNPSAFNALLENRNGLWAEYVHAALMPVAQMPRFYDTVPRFDAERREAGQCSTCYQNHHVPHMVERVYHAGYCTAADIAANFGNTFHFVSLDIEGMDLPVLATLGPLLGSTELLCLEDTIPGTPWDEKHYAKVLAGAARHGFTRVIGRTAYPHPDAPEGRMPANTLLARP